MDYSMFKDMNASWNTEQKIGFLQYCCDKYEIGGTSPITDATYDRYYAELQKIDPDNEFFDSVGGEVDHITGAVVKHSHIMGSLIKCKMENLSKWVSDTFKNFAGNSLTLSHKLDGLSLSLKYSNGNLILAASRGNGTEGYDVTDASLCVRGVKKTIPCKDDVEIRGEVIKFKEDFSKRWAKLYTNERSFASGTMGLEKERLSEVIDRELDFIAYEVLDRSFDFEMDKINFLEEQGFQTLKETTKRTKSGLTLDQIEKAINIYMDAVGSERKNLKYKIDGIVVKTNDIKYGESLGRISNDTRPKSAVALKFKPEEAVTTLISVFYETGRSGKLTPVAILDPVSLDSTTVEKASLHNYGALIGNDAIKIGATVVIAKRGDIIPQVCKYDNSTGTSQIDIPSVCPSCGMPVVWNDTKVDLMCYNVNCPAQLIKRIDNFLKVLQVKGIGESIIGQLTSMQWDNKPIITCIADMYYKLDNDRETEHPFQKYNHIKQNMGDKTYENILKSINSVKEIPLSVFVEALGIARVGSMSKDLVGIAPSIESIDKLTAEDIQGIPGFGPIKASNFITGWKLMRQEITELLKYITIKVDVLSSNKLSGKKFCFTGSFSKPRDHFEKIVVDNGGKCGSAGKDTILCWDGVISGSKYEKSVKVGAKIISEDEFMKMLD